MKKRPESKPHKSRQGPILILSLIVGGLGFLWPGGVNIFMVFGALMLFLIGVIDEPERVKILEAKENGTRDKEL